MASTHLLLHITTRGEWQQALENGTYAAASLETEGFIHCSLPEQVVFVANSRFQGETGLILLCIDSERVESEIRYEGEIDQYPHIYGPLNINAVTEILDFTPMSNGRFALPSALSSSSSM